MQGFNFFVETEFYIAMSYLIIMQKETNSSEELSKKSKEKVYAEICISKIMIKRSIGNR